MMGTMKSVTKAPSNPAVVQACTACRRRKRKCSGEFPCEYCKEKGITCIVPDGKKRGPVSKKHKTFSHSLNDLFTNQFAGITNGIQEAMNKLQQQNTIVDFYFEFVGKGVPTECRMPLSSSPFSDSLIAQLCIVSAHVMRFFSNAALENQFFQEAQKHVPTMLCMDTLDSAVALLMMGSYMGRSTKGSFYATIAYNVAKLPEVNSSWVGKKIEKASHYLSVALDDTIPHRQRCQYVIKEMAGLHILDSTQISDIERVKLSHGRLSAMILLGLGIDLEDTFNLQSYFNNPPVPLTITELEMVMEEVKRLDETQRTMAEGVPAQIVGKYFVHFMNFLILWRTDEPKGALAEAIKAFEFYKANSNIITLWHQKSIIQLLFLSCYFSFCQVHEIFKDSLITMGDSFAKIGNYESFRQLCSELNIDLSLVYNNLIRMEHHEVACDEEVANLFSINSNFDFV